MVIQAGGIQAGECTGKARSAPAVANMGNGEGGPGARLPPQVPSRLVWYKVQGPGRISRWACRLHRDRGIEKFMHKGEGRGGTRWGAGAGQHGIWVFQRMRGEESELVGGEIRRGKEGRTVICVCLRFLKPGCI